MTSSFFEIRLFYVRISPCSIDTVPPSLTISHLRRPIGVCLEINGSKIPSTDATALLLRRDRIDRDASEVTYVCTDGVKLTGAVDFEVVDDNKTLILCGSLEKMDAAWSNGTIGSCGDKDPKTGWSMDCYLAASISGSGFVNPKAGVVNPMVEVYVAGCFGGVPLILTQTVQFSPRRKARLGGLDSIPEDEETGSKGLACRRLAIPPDYSSGAAHTQKTNPVAPEQDCHGITTKNSLVTFVDRRHLSRAVEHGDDLAISTHVLWWKAQSNLCSYPSSYHFASVAEGESDEGGDSDSKLGPTYHPEGWYMDEDGELSWFNAGVRVGVGIGLGMCVGIGIGVGLLMRSYQATTRSFKRRFF